MLDLRRDSGLQGGISGFQSLGCLARSLMFSGGHCREGDFGLNGGRKHLLKTQAQRGAQSAEKQQAPHPCR